jgi:predicted PurR-regulated permease PerM
MPRAHPTRSTGQALGLVGALVAVPAAVALGLVLDEYVLPRTDSA